MRTTSHRFLLVIVGVPLIAMLAWWLAPGSLPATPSDQNSSTDSVDVGEQVQIQRDADRQEVAPREAESASIATRLPPHALQVQVSGRVLDARTGTPIQGATIGVAHDNAASATTGADGTYSLTMTLAETQVILRATGPDHLPRERMVFNRRVPPDGTVHGFDFQLTPRAAAASLCGRILDSFGEPLPDARIRLRSTPPTKAGEWAPSQEVKTRSEANGAFRVDELLPGEWNLAITAPDHEDHDRNSIELHPASNTDLGPIRLDRFAWATLTGTVTDATGRPIEGAKIWVQQPLPRRVATTTDGEGQYLATRIIPGTFYAAFELGDRVAGHCRLTFTRGQTERHDFVIATGPHYVAGKVVLGSEPAARFEVSCSLVGARPDGSITWKTRTDDEGRFRIDNLPSGPVDLDFSREHPWTTYAAAAVAVDRTDHEFRFPAAPRPVTVHGVVRDGDGGPLADVSVATTIPTSRGGRGRTGADGRYRIVLQLSNDVMLPLLAERSGYLSARRSVMHNMIDDQGEIRLDFDMRRADQVGVVEGVVRDDAGQGIHNVACMCRSKGGSGAWRTHTDSQGHFRFKKVLAGEIKLWLRHADYVNGSKVIGTLAAGSRLNSDQTLARLQRYAVRIEVRGAGGRFIPGARIHAWRQDGLYLTDAHTDALGIAALRDLPAGVVNFSAEPKGYPRSVLAHSVAGPVTTPIIMQLQPGTGTIRGLVVTRNGSPRADVEVVVRQKAKAAAVVEAITSTDGSGRFTVGNLPAGQYEVATWRISGEKKILARPDGGEIRIVLE